MSNLAKPNRKPEFRTIPMFIHSDEMIKKVSGYEYYISNYGRVYNSRLKCLRPRINCQTGYQHVNLYKNGKLKSVNIHRLVADAFIANPDNKPFVDHIDRDKLNNHYKNLRYVTRSENGMNVSKKTNNTSGYPGVTWHKATNKWHARIKVNSKYIHLGYFETQSEAIAARQAAVIMHHGIYAPK